MWSLYRLDPCGGMNSEPLLRGQEKVWRAAKPRIENLNEKHIILIPFYFLHFQFGDCLRFERQTCLARGSKGEWKQTKPH